MTDIYFQPVVQLVVSFNLYGPVNRCVGLLAHSSLPMRRRSINKPQRTHHQRQEEGDEEEEKGERHFWD